MEKQAEKEWLKKEAKIREEQEEEERRQMRTSKDTDEGSSQVRQELSLGKGSDKSRSQARVGVVGRRRGLCASTKVSKLFHSIQERVHFSIQAHSFTCSSGSPSCTCHACKHNQLSRYPCALVALSLMHFYNTRGHAQHLNDNLSSCEV